MSRMSALLTTEGTYPYHRGGVSTWCHALISELAEIDFTVLAVTTHPYLEPQYTLAPNVQKVITVPLWGTEDPAEYGHHASFTDYLQRRWATTRQDVEQDYVPAYEAFLTEIAAPAIGGRALGLTLLRMHQFYRRFDYHRAHAEPAVWQTFVTVMQQAWRQQHPQEPAPSIAELKEASGLLYRLMLPLAVDPPRVHLAHSAAAAFCGLPCVMSKLRWNTPYLLTEHGVYLREQYLNIGRSVRSLFVRWFLVGLMNAISDLNYAFADQISPVCQYNTRWEIWRHAEPKRIRVIYNGASPSKFYPAVRVPNARPTVVNMGMIFPLKGQLDLVEAAALVRQTVPDVEFRLYGSPSDEDYYRACRQRVEDLHLEKHVVFAGTTNEPWSVFQQADIVANSSVSEAFPYAVVEAMLSRAAIVATDVGGVREAIGDAGVLVQPHDPAALAQAIAALLQSRDRRDELGARARDRALRWFTEERFVRAYRRSYAQLVNPEDSEVDAEAEPLQMPEGERRRTSAIA